MPNRGHMGTPMGSEYRRLPGWQKRRAKRQKKQEQKWAAQNGPVVTRSIADLSPQEREKLGPPKAGD